MDALGDDGVVDDGGVRLDPRDHGRRSSPDPIRGLHRYPADDGIDLLVLELLLDIVEGLELRLAFEAWADAREQG